MKQFFLFFLIFSVVQVSSAQKKSIKLTDISFQKEFHTQKPLVISHKKDQQGPTVFVPTQPTLMWKRNVSATHYYNNHPANPLCFNQSDGWEMVQVRPMKNQFLYDAAAITSFAVIGGLLEILGQK